MCQYIDQTSQKNQKEEYKNQKKLSTGETRSVLKSPQGAL
jgi:hypothetical protein